MAQDDTAAREADQLKAQLNEQKEALKRKEKEFRDAEAALRRGISRLTFAIGGLDERLDRLLAQLRDGIRESFTTDAILGIVDDIADLVKDLDDQNKSAGASAGTAASLAIRLLAQLEFPDVLRRKVRKLASRYEHAEADATLDAELIDLLRAAIGAGDSPAATGGGLLDRLLSAFSGTPEIPGRDETTQASERSGPAPRQDHARQLLLSLMDRIHVPETDSYTVKTLIARLSASTDSAEFDEIVAQYAEVANASLRTPSAAAVSPQASAAPRIEEVFIQLIEELAVPAEFVGEANRIKDELARDGGLIDFTDAFKSIVNLVTAMRRTLVQEKLELQEFLQQLTVRLHELDQHLGGTQSQQQSWAEEGRKLEAAVQNQVKDIKSSVHVAADLDQLKSVINNRLDVLQQHLDEYQSNEVRRQETLASELAKVKTRLVSVESEADQLRTRLKDKHQQAIIDPLTGVHNRLAYDERVGAEVARWKRYGNPLAIVVLDVDHFKRINDHYGHKAGDKALKLIAQVLTDNLRETDFLARYGGEEFAVLVTETAEDAVAGVTEKLRKAVEECKFHYAGKDVQITISGGYTVFRENDTAESAFTRADGALYRAKERGRNQICPA
jgi:diguanylate cyclase